MPKLYPIALFEGAPGLSIRHDVRGPPPRGIGFLAQPSWLCRSVPEGGTRQGLTLIGDTARVALRWKMGSVQQCSMRVLCPSG